MSTGPRDEQRRDCACPQARHEHGTRVAYVVDRCRCTPCRQANAAYKRANVRRNAYGQSDLVPAQPVREHLAALEKAGIGWTVAADRAGLPWRTVQPLTARSRTGAPHPRARVRRRTADAILAVPVPAVPQPPAGRRNAIGAIRRLRALVCVGWGTAALAAELTARGCKTRKCQVNMLLAAQRTAISAHRYYAIEALYDDLWDRSPPQDTKRAERAALRAQVRARAAGWAPPLAWDDDEIDHPHARPRGAVRWHTDPADEWVTTLHAQGLSDGQIAARVRISKDAAYRARHRLGLPPNRTFGGAPHAPTREETAA